MDWINAVLLLLLTAGHTELQVTIVNRVYSLPLRSRILRRIRHLHDLAIPLFPLLIVWFVGLRGPALLTGGSWSDVPAGWLLVFAVCAAGVAGLFWSMLRWWMHFPPQLLRSNHSRVIDIAAKLGAKPVGEGPLKSLTRLPRNEIFQLEINEKSLRLPRLPRDWDGLTILHLSDLHFTGTIDLPFFREVVEAGRELQPHLVAFTGDLFDRQDLTDWLPETLGRLEAPLGRFFILGNHDWYLNPAETHRILDDLGWTGVAGRTVELDDERIRRAIDSHSPPKSPSETPAESPTTTSTETPRRLVLAGDERPWMGAAPEFGPGSDGEFRLLLSHTPDNLPWAKRRQVDLMLSGHNHGGQIVLPVIGPVYSPSRYGVKYAAGLFWESPTLLHVSRGVSGKQPVRYRCRPELTKLVLRCSDQ